MFKYLLLFVALILLSGCANYVWFKRGASLEHENADKYTCLQESQQPTGGTGIQYGFFSLQHGAGKITNEILYQSCMNAKGWSIEDRSIIEKNVAQDRLNVYLRRVSR